MTPQLYEQYLFLKQRRKKQEAQEALQGFIDSFESDQERQHWVRDFLSRHEEGRKVAYSIYGHLVFPVLRAGYERQDAWSTLWLARTIQNIYGIEALHAAIGYKSEAGLLKEAYTQQPSPEVRRWLLTTSIRWFQYSGHEWPRGILYGFDGATPEQCEEILQEVAFARELDEEGGFQAFLTEFEGKVREYQERVAAAEQI